MIRRRTARWIAAGILLAAFAMLCVGCMSVPVPPSDMGGMKAGQLGVLKARVAVTYEPNYQGLAQAAVDRLIKKQPSGYAK